MAEIINLNRARKSRAKADAKTRAAENRIKFGRSKAETELDAKIGEAVERHLDGHRREDKPN